MLKKKLNHYYDVYNYLIELMPNSRYEKRRKMNQYLKIVRLKLYEEGK